VGVWAVPTPAHIPVLLLQLTFFQWIHAMALEKSVQVKKFRNSLLDDLGLLRLLSASY
jgi:hypothetical protein